VENSDFFIPRVFNALV